MLVRSGVLTAGALKTAEEAREKTLKPIEDILMEEGLVDADVLKQFTALRNKETISRVLSLKDGQYEFKPDDVGVDTRIEEPLAVENVLMDAVRAIDEWPSVQEVIPFYNMTFKATDADVSGKSMDPDEKRVWAMLGDSPGMDVQKVIDRSGMTEFETCKALFGLCNSGVLEPQRPKRGLRVGSMTGGAMAGASRISPMRVALVVLLSLTLLSIAALSARTAWGTATSFLSGRNEDTIKRWAFLESLSMAQRRKIDLALETWKLNRGTYPANLELLVEKGVLEQQDLRYPWKLFYTYRIEGKGYVLFNPPY